MERNESEDGYEIKPTDWGYHCETGDLCPECEKEYRIRLKAFMSRTDEAQNGN